MRARPATCVQCPDDGRFVDGLKEAAEAFGLRTSVSRVYRVVDITVDLFGEEVCEGAVREIEHVAASVAPAKRSRAAEHKARTHTLANGEPAHSFATLIAELSTVVLNTCRTPSKSELATFNVVTKPNDLQHRTLELIQQMSV